ncbi:MAG: PEP-utilizing enzyme [Candidatus Kerfeldbacteria bacterium]
MAKRFRPPFTPESNLFRWGPIPGRLLSVSHWVELFDRRPSRFHQYYWPYSFTIFHDRQMLFVNGMHDLERVGARVFHDFIVGPRRERGWREWLRCRNRLLEFIAALNRIDIRSSSDAQLTSLWRGLNDRIYAFWTPGVIPELGGYGGQAILRHMLQRENLTPAKRIRAYATLSGTDKPSFYQEEEVALAEILKIRNPQARARALQRHTERFSWIGNSFFRTQKVLLARFKERLELLRRKKSPAMQLLKNSRELRRDKKKVLGWMQKPSRLRLISDGVSRCIWWQDQRKKHVFQYLAPMDAIAREMERRARIPKNTFDYAYFWEVSPHPSRQLLKAIARRKQWFVTRWYGRHMDASGKAAQRLGEPFWRPRHEPSTDTLHGIPIFTSIRPINGRVFIVRTHRDLARFPAGHVLVATMTAPEYVVAMRKAAAIVTDTGGITSHAAIVARELKKPCIVGTQQATHVLKNGDLVEVHSRDGYIKKVVE